MVALYGNYSLYGVALIWKKSCTKKLINDKMGRGKYAYEVTHELELTIITTKTQNSKQFTMLHLSLKTSQCRKSYEGDSRNKNAIHVMTSHIVKVLVSYDISGALVHDSNRIWYSLFPDYIAFI